MIITLVHAWIMEDWIKQTTKSVNKSLLNAKIDVPDFQLRLHLIQWHGIKIFT